MPTRGGAVEIATSRASSVCPFAHQRGAVADPQSRKGLGVVPANSSKVIGLATSEAAEQEIPSVP
jgi:hypothetical protein